MNIKEFMGHVEGFGEAVGERETLKRVFGDLAIPKGFAENYIKLLHPKKIAVGVTDIFRGDPIHQDLPTGTRRGVPAPLSGGAVRQLGGYHWKREDRPGIFDLVSPHQRGFYELTVKRMEPGFVSGHLLDTVKVGDEFYDLRASGVLLSRAADRRERSRLDRRGIGGHPVQEYHQGSNGAGARSEDLAHLRDKDSGRRDFRRGICRHSFSTQERPIRVGRLRTRVRLQGHHRIHHQRRD